MSSLRHSHIPSGRRPLLVVLALFGVAVLLVPVLFLVRGGAYRGVVGWSDGLPGIVRGAIDAISSDGIWVLIVLFCVAALLARRRGLPELARGVAAGVGVVAAYLCSELIKQVFSELRPCRNFEVATIADCPAPTDWSWPSNHSTIAMAIAVGILAMAPRLGLFAMPWAALIALSRVAVGVHYPHDVLAGVLLAMLVVVLAARFLTPHVERLLVRMTRNPVMARVLEGSARDHRPTSS
jgi:membrane-associated phospholipid phosphatase